MLFYLLSGLGIMDNAFLSLSLVGVLGYFLGRFLKSWACLAVTLVLVIVLIIETGWMFVTFEELATLFALVEAYYGSVLLLSMWISVLVQKRIGAE